MYNFSFKVQCFTEAQNIFGLPDALEARDLTERMRLTECAPVLLSSKNLPSVQVVDQGGISAQLIENIIDL